MSEGANKETADGIDPRMSVNQATPSSSSAASRLPVVDGGNGG